MTDADALTEALTRALGGAVHGVRRLSGGASRTTWACEWTASGPARPLVVQVARTPPGAAVADAADQATLLRQAALAGVPVPAVVASGDGAGDGFDGAWLVTERLDGETIPRKLLRDPEYAAARAGLVGEAARALAAVHSMPVERAGPLPGGDQLEQFGDILHAFSPPRPALELALRLLRARRAARPALPEEAVVHGDFRTGNLLVGPDGLRAVLDWELAHTGDPLEDLGWFCVRAWRFGGPGTAGGFGSMEELVAAYAQARRRPVELDQVVWWQAVGTFKWAVMCMIQAASARAGGRTSVELATIGRRVCENEWDLLGLLGAETLDEPPLDGDAPATDGAAAELFGRPTAPELVEAVRRFVVDDVVDQTDGRLQFNARVAGTALGIVGRQLELQPAVLERQRRRLDTLGVADEAALAGEIRAGTLDDRTTEVAAVLLASVGDQLAVSNPGYREPR